MSDTEAPAVGDVPDLIERLLACPGLDDPECNCAEAASRLAALQQRVEELEEQAHYANGTADLAMKHRDAAEALMEEMTRQRDEARAAYGDCIETQNLSVAEIERLRGALEATEQPLALASHCLDGIVSMDDEDQGKDGGSATCQAVKKTVDRALKRVRAALSGQGQP
jgi:chromosome segregation ATPase